MPPKKVLDPIERVSPTTRKTIYNLLKDGTPDWVKHPHDYRSMAEEDVLRHEEETRARNAAHADPDQGILSDERRIGYRIMHVGEFLSRLRKAGIRCWARASNTPGLAGLWAMVPTPNGESLEHISAMQEPCMSEWGVMGVGKLGDVQGARYIGWREAVMQLIQWGLLGEAQARQIFGEPTPQFSERYSRTLKALRQQGKVKP